MAKSNLFAIDFDAALRTVAEANSHLVARHERLMEARGRVPSPLGDDRDVERARRFLHLLKAVGDGCRRARLDDTRPLRAFVGRVEGFFKAMEAEAAQARAEVLALLTDAARKRGNAQPAPVAIVHNARSGEVLGTTAAHPSAGRPAASSVVPCGAAPIPTTWEVSSVDRSKVDLESLRPFLTEAALLTAARAHLKANGPSALKGASYVETAVPW